MSETALITTTINVPELLLDYARDAKNHGRSVKLCVAGDRKTPAAAADLCAKVEVETGLDCEYMGVEAQEKFLAQYSDLRDLLPWNCVQRRNVAILKCYADGADTIVTIDDDNLLDQEDYFGSHACVGEETCLDSFGKSGSWFNVCRFLTTANGYQFVPRGYGMRARSELEGAQDPLPDAGRVTMRVAASAGLWTGDPDIDAVTRLACMPVVTGYSREESFFVAPGALCPFNSQNTALSRATIPAYFLSPSVGRFDDILASFIVKRIADHLGEGISFGKPLVRQVRNEHDLFRDLELEMMGMRVVDGFTEALAGAKLSHAGYAGCVPEVIDHLKGSMADYAYSKNDKESLKAFLSGYRVWSSLRLWN